MSQARRVPVRCATATIVLALFGAAPSVGETLEYHIDVPAGRSVTFNLDLEVRHAGLLAVEAEWTGRRSLALKLDPPVSPWPLRRTGPSPQLLETTIAEGDEAALGTWRLQIHALAARAPASGTLTVRLPEPPGASTEETGAATEPPAPPPDPWLLPRRVERGLPGSWERFVQAVERFRSDLAEAAAPERPDACRWQEDLMRFLAERRDRLVDYGQAPADSTRELLSRISGAIERVEQLRASDDPLLNGPPPADPGLAATWRALRRQRIGEIESELDSVLELVHRAHSPELEREPWAGRLVSCLTACERFFEQRARVGDERATNRDLARDQWSRLLLAADALEALARLRAP